MTTTEKQSLVVRHVGDIYRNANSGKGQSWSILNGALHTALANCIGAHLPFEVDDFATLYDRFRGGFWFGTDNDGKGMGGRYYSLSVECGNMSACLAFEKWKGFAPYLYMGNRLAVYGEVWWLNKPAVELIKTVQKNTTEKEVCDNIFCRSFANRWWVTGISSEAIRLASYHRENNPFGDRDGKPTKLMQLTHEQLDTASREIRKAIKAARPVEKKEKAEA